MASGYSASLAGQLRLRDGVAPPLAQTHVGSARCPNSPIRSRRAWHFPTGRSSQRLSSPRCRASIRDGQEYTLSNTDLAFRAIEEIRTVFDKIAGSASTCRASSLTDDSGESDPFQMLVEAIRSAKDGKIALYGVGREGLMMRALAMRLYHLGLQASVVGDMSCPPIGRGDLLIVSAGPGRFSTVEALLGEARSAGARSVVITAQPSGSCARLADCVVYIPAQTMADDVESGVVTVAPGGNADSDEDTGEVQQQVLPMGSIYEGALFVLGEVVVRLLRDELGETRDTMRERHTNLE